jgi:hypothetical protein
LAGSRRGERLADVAKDAGVLRKSLDEWRADERLVGRQQADLDFFRQALRLIDALEAKALSASCAEPYETTRIGQIGPEVGNCQL